MDIQTTESMSRPEYILNKINILSIKLLIILAFGSSIILAQDKSNFEIKSPDGIVNVHVEAGAKFQWSVTHNGQPIIAPSSISLQLEDGRVLGDNAKVISTKKDSADNVIAAINYIKSNIPDKFKQLTINCQGDFSIIFRVYNDAVAYRFVMKQIEEITIKNEEANFNFTDDQKAFIPIMWDYRGNKIFNSSFEALYREINISQMPKDSLAFLPILVDVGNNKKVVITEADLEDYPGMYMNINQTGKGLMGVYAPYPLEAQLGGWGNINYIPTKRAAYIAKIKCPRSLPWRVAAISTSDKELLNNDVVQKLASPSRLNDISWIKPGQVAWDWWNNWNITHVDFKAGINTSTYKYYIDFAAANKIKYIIMDAGWSDLADLAKVIPEIDLEEILDYSRQKNVGVILWASWYTVTRQMDEIFYLYSKMGVKGFKIDFVDRDDQAAVTSLYNIARKAAEYHLLVDFHGVFKPAGLQRTYPNVIGFEGVKGLENYKWAMEDQPRYCVSIPFIRMLAGPMDYTPGAMRNAAMDNFRPVNNNPMSQGTRCAQLAMYVMYEAPLQMLSDNPTIYMKEQECTNFITSIPTTFDETVPLDGKVGEYAAVARRKGNTWYVATMTNWTARDLTLDFSFLGKGTYGAVVYKDGTNADRDGTDYKSEKIKISSSSKLNIHLAPGGGWVARIEKFKR
jgi:alpha-glucosidase